MSEEHNQSVRYSQIMSNFSGDSFETSSIQFLLTRKNEMNWYKKKKMLLGLVSLVIFVLMVSIVAMVPLEKNSMNTVMNQENLKIQNSNSFATTISLSNLSIMIDHETTKITISPSFSIKPKFPSSKIAPTTKHLKNNDLKTTPSFSTSTSITMDINVTDDMKNKIADFSTLPLPFRDTIDDVTNEKTTFPPTTRYSDNEKEGN